MNGTFDIYTDKRDGVAGSGRPGTEERIDALTHVAHVQLREQRQSGAARFFPPLFLAVLFALLLVALTCGVRVYSSVAAKQSAANASREGLDLIANSVRANDAQGAIAVGSGPEGRALVVKQKLDSGTYEIRTYLYQGKVLQEYAIEGNAYSPETANELAESESFSFGYRDGLLSITTDQGTCEVALRSMQGGE